jgi:rubredoxin
VGAPPHVEPGAIGRHHGKPGTARHNEARPDGAAARARFPVISRVARAIPVIEKGRTPGHASNRLNEGRAVSEVIEYKSWVCLICGWIYNEEEGLPDEGIAAGTRFADIPADWRCPLCDVSKAEFTVVEF